MSLSFATTSFLTSCSSPASSPGQAPSSSPPPPRLFAPLYPTRWQCLNSTTLSRTTYFSSPYDIPLHTTSIPRDVHPQVNQHHFRVQHSSSNFLTDFLSGDFRKSSNRNKTEDENLRRRITMRIVGLTGGIASGKSTVSDLFKTHGVPVVDADIVARDALKKGTGGWKKVVAAFGEEILRPDGEVDRPKLGQIVFSDPGKRHLLNRLLAPYISSGIFWQIFKLWVKGSKVIVLDIPLLFEAKMDKWTKPIIVVWVDPEIQLQRLRARDRSSEEDARNRINAQMSLDMKRSKADIVIDNTGSLDDLKEEFQKVLYEVTRPLTWTEFWLSRQGAFSVLISIVIGVVVCKKIL